MYNFRMKPLGILNMGPSFFVVVKKSNLKIKLVFDLIDNNNRSYNLERNEICQTSNLTIVATAVYAR